MELSRIALSRELVFNCMISYESEVYQKAPHQGITTGSKAEDHPASVPDRNRQLLANCP